MYELTVERVFSAAHAISINNEVEPLHGHNWQVRIVVRGGQLDGNGLLCDFHVLERRLDQVISGWNNRCLNDLPPFDRVNPTAEHVARGIADAFDGSLPGDARVHCVSVTEAPGCIATYYPDHD